MSREADPRRYDAITDSLAVVKAVHDNDDAALKYLMSVADLRDTSVFLAELCADLIGSFAAANDTSPADLIGRIRARQLHDGPSRDW